MGRELRQETGQRRPLRLPRAAARRRALPPPVACCAKHNSQPSVPRSHCGDERLPQAHRAAESGRCTVCYCSCWHRLGRRRRSSKQRRRTQQQRRSDAHTPAIVMS